MTVAGCLKAWDATMAAPSTAPATPGATPGASAPAMAGKFVLTNVQDDASGAPGMAAAKPDTSAAGAAKSADSKAATKQYMLTADSGVNLQAHLNHQVRVTGKMTDAAPTTATADAARSTTDRDSMAKAWPTLTVSSVTMVSATCTGATN